jgi:SAM-dependent methyltransferase
MNILKNIFGQLYICFTYPFYLAFLFYRNLIVFYKNPLLLLVDIKIFFYYIFNYSLSIQRYEQEKARLKILDDSCLIYGETPYFSLEKILDNIPVTKDSVFFDLGCGKGRLCFYVECMLNVKSFGFDLIPTYIKTANKIATKHGFASKFILKDIFAVDLKDVDILYVAGTCFSKEQRKKLLNKIISIRPGAWIISTSYGFDHSSLKLKKELDCWFSWGAGKAYIYQVMAHSSNTC